MLSARLEARIAPPMAPSIVIEPMTAAKVPRTAAGTRSGRIAVKGPCTMLNEICTSTQHSVMSMRELENPRAMSASPPRSAPPTRYGARRP